MVNSTKNIAVLILAAGTSSRMKDIKQLLKINNKTLLENTITTVENVFTENIYCILGANAKKIQQATTTKTTTFLFNKHFKKGLSTSIVCGMQHLKKQLLPLDAVLVVLADQPEVNEGYLQELTTTFKKNKHQIIASDYHKNSGVPAIFPKKYFEELLLLEGDKGAKKFLQKYLSNTITIKRKHPFKDLDTQEEYLSYIKSI